MNSSIFLTPVTDDEVKSIIAGIKNKNSAGLDEISPKILKSIIKNRHGFIKNRYTTSAMLSLINGVVNDLDNS